MKTLCLLIFNVSSLYPGPDGIPGCVLRYCVEALCKPLLKLHTLYLESSQFPNLWKKSFVIPLHKKSSKVEACNYRGISKLSEVPKLIENIITSDLQHLCRSVISPCQHGFIKRRSTTTNLLDLTSFVIKGSTIIFKQTPFTLTLFKHLTLLITLFWLENWIY